jgi:hypothetical protein
VCRTPLGDGTERRFVLDAFGDDAQAKPPTETGDCLHYRSVGPVFQRVTHE